MLWWLRLDWIAAVAPSPNVAITVDKYRRASVQDRIDLICSAAIWVEPVVQHVRGFGENPNFQAADVVSDLDEFDALDLGPRFTQVRVGVQERNQSLGVTRVFFGAAVQAGLHRLVQRCNVKRRDLDLLATLGALE